MNTHCMREIYWACTQTVISRLSISMGMHSPFLILFFLTIDVYNSLTPVVRDNVETC